MNAYLKTSFSVAAVAAVALGFVASTWAQSYLDGSAKMRGDYGQLPRISRIVPMYQAAAPTVARSYSYEPAPNTKVEKGNTAKSNPIAAPNATAQRNTRTTRSFSYEPGMGVSFVRSFATPLYELPKSDSRKLGDR
jgi:hypothetical protein